MVYHDECGLAALLKQVCEIHRHRWYLADSNFNMWHSFSHMCVRITQSNCLGAIGAPWLWWGVGDVVMVLGDNIIVLGDSMMILGDSILVLDDSMVLLGDSMVGCR